MREPEAIARLRTEAGRARLPGEARRVLIERLSAPRAERGRRRLFLWTGALGLAGAAACTLWWSASGGRDGEAIIVASGALSPVSPARGQPDRAGESSRDESPVRPGTRLRSGDRIQAPASAGVRAQVGSHAVDVGAGSALALEALSGPELRFRVEHGSATFTVAPLAPGRLLIVDAGELRVQVVGTIFRVARAGACSAVSVSQGRVATFFQGATALVGAGDERTYCSGAEGVRGTSPVADAPPARPGPSLAPPAVPAGDAAAAPRERPRAVESRPPAEAPAAPAPPGQALTAEERLFRDATRAPLGSPERLAQLEGYLERFPTGVFAEDALFQIIRARYSVSESGEVVRRSEQFLRQYARGRRATEVQLLYLQSLLETGASLSGAPQVLNALLSHMDRLTTEQRDQATYLAILAHCEDGAVELCGRWIETYLRQFPAGRYSARVRALASERGRRP